MHPTSEESFHLPQGYLDSSGVLHRDGVLRPATLREEVGALSDFRAHLYPESFLSVLLAKVIRRLGTLPSVDSGVFERLPECDRIHLESLYRTMNGYRVNGNRVNGNRVNGTDGETVE